jgi:hypothetical protein
MNKLLKWTDLGEDDVYFNTENDPVLKQYIKKEGGFTWDISRILQKVPYSGSSTQQEMLELEQHIRDLISEGKYSYKYIENFLVSLGYNLNKIRRVYKKLTGVEPDIYLDEQPYLDTPSTIPGINYGWGEAKDNKYEYYFIMPWADKYCIFGQKGIDREIISEHYTLESALKELEGKVKKLYTFDHVLTKKDLKSRKNIHSPEDIPAGIKIAKDKTEDVVTELIEKEEFIDEKTPSEFFEESSEEMTPDIVDAIKTIFDYISSLNIPGYTVQIKDLMYRSQKGEVFDTQPSVEGVEMTKTTFETPAYFAAVLVFIRDSVSKKGLTIFTYNTLDNALETRGTFKGEDGKLYGLNVEGLNQYFNV